MLFSACQETYVRSTLRKTLLKAYTAAKYYQTIHPGNLGQTSQFKKKKQQKNPYIFMQMN